MSCKRFGRSRTQSRLVYCRLVTMNAAFAKHAKHSRNSGSAILAGSAFLVGALRLFRRVSKTLPLGDRFPGELARCDLGARPDQFESA